MFDELFLFPNSSGFISPQTPGNMPPRYDLFIQLLRYSLTAYCWYLSRIISKGITVRFLQPSKPNWEHGRSIWDTTSISEFRKPICLCSFFEFTTFFLFWRKPVWVRRARALARNMQCLRIEFKSVVLRYQFESKYLLKKVEQRKVRVMNVERNLGSSGF